MKAISLTYQRNGVAGEGFFQFVYKHREEGLKLKEMLFIATFDIKNECTPDECIDWSTCRVTSVDHPEFAWRGDRIAGDIERYLYKIYGKPAGTPDDYFYHLIDKVNNNIKTSK